MYCRNCGVQINDFDTYCFNCGAKQNVVINNSKPIFLSEKPKPVYKKGWFWVLIIVAIIALFSTLATVFKFISNFNLSKKYNGNNPFDYEEFFDEQNENFEYDFDFE